MVEFRCPSCGTGLADNLAKCPSCGLPLKPSAASASNRSLFAAFLLLSLFAVGSLVGVLYIVNPDLALQPNTTFPVGSFDVSGRVLDANGTAVSNATVVLNPTHNATSDATGSFHIANASFGVYDLNVTKENQSAVVRIGVRANLQVNVTLPGHAGTTRTEDGSIAFFRSFSLIAGGVLLTLCFITLLGTIACYRRRAWALALTGAITGSLLWLPLSLLLGLIAVVLLAKARNEFR